MVDMARDPEEMAEGMMAQEYTPPAYPYGLCISLTHNELEKLDMDADCEVGDLLHMVCMAKVMSITKNEDSCRIEMQIMDIETLEDENQEFTPRKARNPYV